MTGVQTCALPIYLTWALESLADGSVVNKIQVPKRTAEFAKVALDQMLALP